MWNQLYDLVYFACGGAKIDRKVDRKVDFLVSGQILKLALRK